MKQAVAYARYSSDNQRAESITAQLRAIHKYAAKNKINIIKEYIDEALTATNDDRKNFQMLMDEISFLKPDLVLVHKLDRFARNKDDAGHYRWLLKKSGNIRLVAVEQDFGEGPEAVLVEANLEGVADYFSKNLSREVKKGQYENVLQGMHCGGVPLLGYDTKDVIRHKNKHNKKPKIYVINEQEAQAVRMIFNMKLAGSSYQEIAAALNNAGFTTKKGNPFGKNSLHDILRNEKYIGNYVFRKTSPNNSRVAADPLALLRVEGVIPRIIDDDTFYRVQDILDGRRCQPRIRSDIIYLLAGIARCGECGHAMVADSYTSKGKHYAYYRCNNATRTHGKACSNNKKYNKQQLENEVIMQSRAALDILKLSAEKAIDVIYERAQAQCQAENTIRHEALAELSDIQNKIDNLVTSIADGVDAKILAPKLNDLGRKKEALQKQIKKGEAHSITREQAWEYIQTIISKSLDESDPLLCRDNLKSLFGEIQIYKDAVILPLERLGLER